MSIATSSSVYSDGNSLVHYVQSKGSAAHLWLRPDNADPLVSVSEFVAPARMPRRSSVSLRLEPSRLPSEVWKVRHGWLLYEDDCLRFSRVLRYFGNGRSGKCGTESAKRVSNFRRSPVCLGVLGDNRSFGRISLVCWCRPKYNHCPYLKPWLEFYLLGSSGCDLLLLRFQDSAFISPTAIIRRSRSGATMCGATYGFYCLYARF